jgi:uncharacterized protein (DUF302 family)
MRRFALLTAAALAAGGPIAPPASAESAAVATAMADGVLRQQSAHGFDETVRRLRADISSKGIPVFAEIDQARLGAGASLTIRRSTLLLFGNPPLGVQFLQSNPLAGLDWPVRMLIVEDQSGRVWVAWTDFGFIARRYGIADRDAQFAMARDVAASIASSAH